MYASFLMISRALHLDVFEQPAENYFFKNLLGVASCPLMAASGQI
jgi:hypothetical protein